MTFLANSDSILQITHAKTFKTRYTRCQYNNLLKDIDKYAFMCGSNFYETDVIMSYKTLNDLNILVKQGYNLAKNLKTQFWKN